MRYLLSALSLSAAALAQAQQQRPNVIFLVADDLGYGDLSCYGTKAIQTPAVDSVAASGVRFTDCHAVAATSTPSRFSLLTGEYCYRHPNTDIATGDAALLIPKDKFTLADLFKSQGYTTAAIGKWHLGLGSKTGAQNWNKPLDVTPRDIGFDYHYLMAATADRVPCVFIEQGSVANYDASAPIQVSYTRNFDGEPTGANNPELLTKLVHSHGHNNSIVNGIGRIGWMKGGGKALWRDEDIADSIAAHAMDFMEEHKEDPFFMYLCTNDVHVPRYPHERFRGKSRMGLRGEAILQFDHTIRQIVHKLEELGLRENTLLIITSDNGPVLDDGYQDQAIPLAQAAGHKPGGPWRGGKYSCFEAGTAVPFIVSWPAQVEAGGVSDALISHIDDMASMACLLGTELPAGAATDSRNALSTWLGKDRQDRDYVMEMAADRSLSVRTPEWKYIEPSDGPAVQGNTHIEMGYLPTPQLYHISADKGEKKNLYSTQRAVADSLASIMLEARLPRISDESTSYWYQLYTPQRGNRAITSTGAGKGLTGQASAKAKRSQWRFVRRADGKLNIQNRSDLGYIAPGQVVLPALQLKTAVAAPATGWELQTDGRHNGRYIIVNGDSQVNQATEGLGWKILNWGNGTNQNDAGCNYWSDLLDVEHHELPEGIGLPEAGQNTNGPHADNPAPAVYDLAGRRLRSDSTARGILIVDGQKVVR